jgi:hypothetical protein
MIFRIYHQQLGGHVHCRLFAGRSEGALGNCGNFVMRVEEFTALLSRDPVIEFRYEDGLLPEEGSLSIKEERRLMKMDDV